MDHDKPFVPYYDKRDRDHMRRLLRDSSQIIDLIAEDQVPFGSYESAGLIDSATAADWNECRKQKDDDELQELKDDLYSIVNLYGAVKKEPAFLPLYKQLANLLCTYGLFYEYVCLLENAVAGGGFSDSDLDAAKENLSKARRFLEADDADMSDSERISEDLRRALLKKPMDKEVIKSLLERCTDDAVLYDIACNSGRDPEKTFIREKAARRIGSRDYRYALSSHLRSDARTSMILDLYDPLEGDDLFIARTILTDPDDRNKAHMLLYCKDEALLMLGRRYVYGARKLCEEHLHDMGSRFPEAYQEMDEQGRSQCEREFLDHASELALELLSEDEAVNGRLSGGADVDSDPLHFFLSIHHPRPALRWWHAKKLENQVRIAYAGSWTSDDKIKESLSVKITNTRLITEMIFGDDSEMDAVDMVFAFRKPEDLTLQDRFCVEIMKNNPAPEIREQVRKALLRGNIEIPGVDLTRPDPLYKGG